MKAQLIVGTILLASEYESFESGISEYTDDKGQFITYATLPLYPPLKSSTACEGRIDCLWKHFCY